MSDLISKAEVLSLVEHMMETYWDRKQILSIVRNGIEKLPSAQQWTPVSEGLPRKKGWYIISHEKGIVTYDRWLGDDGWDGFTHIKAWMPLPEPYEGGEA